MPAVHPGFTLVELLIVVAIIVLLAGLGLSGASVARESARSTACASNQRQILLAMLMFRPDHQGEWPGAPTIKVGPYIYIDRYPDGRPKALASSPIIFGACAAWVPMAGLEVLSSWSEGELGRRVFTCPSSGTGPQVDANPRLIEEFEDGCTPIERPRWQDIRDSAYAYDDRVRGDARAARVVLGDRPIDRETTAHGLRTIVAFADGRTATLRRSGTSGIGGRFRDWTSTYEWVTMQVVNELAGDDNIYDPVGDGLFADQPGVVPPDGTLADRCWLR